MIKKVGDKYNVYTEDGKTLLGSHSDHASAVRQLAAIEISKHKGEKGATQPRKSKK